MPEVCNCSDPGCTCCHGHCRSDATTTVYRVDMDDATGTPMCLGCAEDAMYSDLFRYDCVCGDPNCPSPGDCDAISCDD